MKKWFYILAIFILIGCKPTSYVPIEHKTVISYKDSTIFHQDTIHVSIEKEAYNYYSSLLDTLYMETNYAYSTAYIDTTNNLLNGHISNKPIDIPVIYEWRDRIITNDTTIYKDIPMYIEQMPKAKEIELLTYKHINRVLGIIIIGLGIIVIIQRIRK
jgi:hypothetical protein